MFLVVCFGLMFVYLISCVRAEKCSLREVTSLTIVLLAMLFALCGCSQGDATPTTKVDAPTVQWGVSYDRGYMFLEVEIVGDVHASQLLLSLDRQAGNSDLVDNCVHVTSVRSGEVFTWFAAADAEHSTILLVDPGTTPLTKGKYVLPLEFRLHRDMEDSSKDKWMTPKVTACKVK